MTRMIKAKKDGFVIAFATMSLVILLAAGLGLLSLGHQSRIASAKTFSQIGAMHAADAGLTKALVELNNALKAKTIQADELPAATGETLPNCPATFSYTIEKDRRLDTYIINSSGTYGRSTRTVNATLRLKSPFEYAIFSEQGISLKNSAFIDWYNNDPEDVLLTVGTNSTSAGAITLKNSARINGNVAVGPGAEPDTVIDQQNSAVITGSTYSLPVSLQIEQPAVPDYLQMLPCQENIKNDTTISSSAKYSGIDLKNSKTITINGDVELYIVGGITLGNSAKIEIDNTNPDSSLTLYLGENFEGKNSSAINNKTADAKKLRIYGLDDCTEMIFKNGTEFYGTIYAPNADVTFDNSADAFGSVVAKSFEQKNSAGFYYDASLRNATINDELVRFVVKRWSEY